MVIVSSMDLSDVPEAVAVLESVGTLLRVSEERAAIVAALRNADAFLTGAAVRVDDALLQAAPRLRVIGAPSTGTDHLDHVAIAARGITLFHLANERALLDTFTATSELAFALLLALIRNIRPAMADAERGIWSRERHTGFQLFGKTFGVLGLGRLGTISARIANGFGMRVIACDVRDVAAPDVTMVDVPTLLRESDVLSLHIHLTPETTGIIGVAALAAMKPGAILLNTSRGKIVDERALLDALRSGHLGGAGLDVIDGEWLSVEERMRHPLIAYAR
ncbi:MAG: NAD(P)-dependent oxidoreductase, partial [bacterium]|nr:NAD(P)-dependent oxidoreductase [bacterium]